MAGRIIAQIYPQINYIFVVIEIIKQLSWSENTLKPYHFSIHKGAEVDLVLEDRMGYLYGVEISQIYAGSRTGQK